MMNKKFLLITCVTLALTFMLNAQESVNSGERRTRANAYKTTWEKNRFRDNWFISFGVGTQVLMGEDDNKGAFTDILTFAPSLTIGKYFSPIWGLNLNLTGGSLHGFNDGIGGHYRKWQYMEGNQYYQNITFDPQWTHRGWGTPDQVLNGDLKFGESGIDEWRWAPGMNGELYMQHMRYFGASLNFQFDLLTLFGDYDPKRVFDLTPSAGINYFHVFEYFGNDVYDGIGANVALQAKFRVGKKAHLFAEGRLAVYPDDFDGHGGDNITNDLVAQGIAGLTIDLGKNTWSISEPMDYQYIKDLNNQINALQQQIIDLKNTPPECPPVPQPPVVEPSRPQQPQPQKAINFLPDPVFFRIDKAIIDANEWAKIEKAANFLKRHPGANVVVTGYADRETAYPAYNLKLSERRSKAVAKALIEKYGINPLRISINWEGDQIQPFSINDWNRVVIFVIE